MVLRPYMDRLKKEYVQELLLLLSDWKATLRFSLGVSSWKWYGWANRSSVYIPYLFCQLCSDSSVRPLWGARMAQWMSTRLPTKWPGFKSRHQYHMWVGFVVDSLPSSERLFPGYSGFPLSLKTNTSKFQFDLERTDTPQRVLLSAPWVNKSQQVTNNNFYSHEN